MAIIFTPIGFFYDAPNIKSSKILTPKQLVNSKTALLVAEYVNSGGRSGYSPAVEATLITVPPLPPLFRSISSTAFKVPFITAV